MAFIFPLFVPAIRDYIDVLNNAYDSVVSNNNLQEILQQSIIYLFASIKFLFIYFLSFQWLQDLSYLPVVIPQIKLEILKEQFFLHTPQSVFFTFLEIPSYSNNKFFLGFANSLFLCLPLSVAHIISIRRLLIQGLSAGVFSSLGTICGQVLLLTCILFGGRVFITPWFNFQILNYCIGIWVVLKIVYEMAHERSIRIIDNSNTTVLAQIFLLNFILAWTEQSCIFQYFGNLTLGAEPSNIEIFSSLSALQSILAHITYILGIFIGDILFTSLFIFLTLKLSNLCVQLLSILYSRWVRKLNFALITLIISFTFTSIPFYSFDYLVLSNLGFVSQDKSLKNTLFSGTKIPDFVPPTLGDKSNTYIDQTPGIDTDITRFNKGRYLMFDVNDSFEQLNYQGEYAWLTMKHRTPTVSRQPSSSRVLSKVSKFFKQNKKLSRRKISPTQNEVRVNQENNSKNSANTEPSPDIDLIKLLNVRHKIEARITNSFETLINTSVSNKFFVTQDSSTPTLEKNFIQKYYSNPIYKLLLSSDIDLFLSRQPSSFVLSPNEEHNLFKKRIILANYYDSLRYYNQLPYAEEFQDLFNLSKTYADRVYNQQFNGTLKIVRRLFSINADQAGEKVISDNPSARGAQVPTPSFNSGDAFILKFDQPLYKKINLKSSSSHSNLDIAQLQSLSNSFFHEEFTGNRKNKNDLQQDTVSSSNLTVLKAKPGSQVTRSDGTLNPKVQSNHVSNTFEHDIHGDVLGTYGRSQVDSHHENNVEVQNNQLSNTKPFIELINPIPFYVGWDEQLRKLVITNRLSPVSVAGESMKFSNKNYENNYYTLNRLIQKNKTINFTTWPLPKNTLKNINQGTSSVALPSQAKPERPTWLRNHVDRSQSTNKKRSSAGLTSNTYNFLFESITDPENNQKLRTLIAQDINLQKLLDEDLLTMEEYGKLTSVPSNIILNGGRGNGQDAGGQLQDIIPYTRGGFVWPGHSDLKIKFKNLVPL